MSTGTETVTSFVRERVQDARDLLGRMADDCAEDDGVVICDAVAALDDCLAEYDRAELCPAGTLDALREALAFVDGACAATGHMVPCWANAARGLLERGNKEG